MIASELASVIVRISGQRARVASFSEDLRKAREERGVSVAAICESTKVSKRHILALEAGELSELPGGVFRKGFVRSYLRVLGLDEAPWMERFEESCRAHGVRNTAETEWVTFAENVKNSRVAPRGRRGIRWAGFVLLLVALAAAGWFGWRLMHHHRLVPLPMVWLVMNSWVDNGASR